MKYITIDEDIYISLKGFYFGDTTDAYKAACFRAYRDFNRTIEFPISLSNLSKVESKIESERRYNIKVGVIDVIKEEIHDLTNKEMLDQDSFDSWHNSLCQKLIGIYEDNNIPLTYGHAQKWINMTIKYLFCLGTETFSREFQYLHIPIDNYVMDIAKKKFLITKPKVVWSKWNCDQYVLYHNKLRSCIIKEAPLRWEFYNWLEIARNATVNED